MAEAITFEVLKNHFSAICEKADTSLMTIKEAREAVAQRMGYKDGEIDELFKINEENRNMLSKAIREVVCQLTAKSQHDENDEGNKKDTADGNPLKRPLEVVEDEDKDGIDYSSDTDLIQPKQKKRSRVEMQFNEEETLRKEKLCKLISTRFSTNILHDLPMGTPTEYLNELENRVVQGCISIGLVTEPRLPTHEEEEEYDTQKSLKIEKIDAKNIIEGSRRRRPATTTAQQKNIENTNKSENEGTDSADDDSEEYEQDDQNENDDDDDDDDDDNDEDDVDNEEDESQEEQEDGEASDTQEEIATDAKTKTKGKAGSSETPSTTNKSNKQELAESEAPSTTEKSKRRYRNAKAT